MSGGSVLIVDDEPLARRRIARLLAKMAWVERVAEARDVVDACGKVEQLHPDIVLLDIQMPGGSGFDLLDRLSDQPPVVVFVTAFDHHAIQAFAANAVDYVTKPIDPNRFAVAMERARVAASSRHQVDRIAELQETVASLKRALAGAHVNKKTPGEFWIKVCGDYLRITQESILRIQAEGDYVRIYVPGKNYLLQETLSSLEQRLDAAEFSRIHRGCIVRRQAIARIRRGPFAAKIVVLSDGAEVRVGRTYEAAIRQLLAEQ